VSSFYGLSVVLISTINIATDFASRAATSNGEGYGGSFFYDQSSVEITNISVRRGLHEIFLVVHGLKM
jgi:hypothetical protein